MATHKAAVVHELGGKPVVESVPTLKPGAGEVLVRIVVAATNPVDWKIVKYNRFGLKFPLILGIDGAGEVEEVGEGVSNLKKGDRVAVFSLIRNETNTFQEKVIAAADIIFKLPYHVRYEQAATIPLGYLTSVVGLYADIGLPIPSEKAKLNTPLADNAEPLLVWGAASSVGQYAVQLARLSGFKVIATASPHNFDLIKSLGASEVFDYKDPEVVEKIKQAASSGGGIRYVYDSISEKGTTEQAAKTITKPDGHIAVVLDSKPDRDDVKLSRVFALRAHNVDGKNAETKEISKKLIHLAEKWLEEGQLKPNKTQTVQGGLNSIAEGWQLNEKGVSGVKIIHIFDDKYNQDGLAWIKLSN